MSANDTESDAAQWLVRLDGDPSPEVRAEFEAWMAAHPRNQAAYIRMQKTWIHADILQRLRPLDGLIDEQVVDKFGERPQLFDEPKPEQRRGRPLLAVAASVLIVGVGVAAWAFVQHSRWQVYKTEFGGFQRVVLADGSTALLNTDSQIRVRINSERREIVLEKGETLFAVAHDRARPFNVTAGDTVVRAVGTEFSVRLRDHSQVDVLVKEGRVAIDPPDDSSDAKLPEPVMLPNVATVSAGQAVSVKAHRRQQVEEIATEEVTRKLAWTKGRISFDRVTLGEAVSEFNRYNRQQLVIDDPAIADLHIGGAFDATDLQSFVDALQPFGIRAINTQNKADDPSSQVIRLVGGSSRN
jgi:transmembrane sensor